MSVLKKVSAAALCAAVTASLASCSLGGADTTYGAEIDGYRIPAGVFISMQMDAYYDARNYIEVPSGETGTTASSSESVTSSESETETVTTPFTDKVIENKAVRDWINDEATKSMQEFVAVENKFDELGLAFDDNEDQKTKIYIDSLWEMYGEMYEELGISENSQILVSLNSQKKSLIFDHYYGKGGDREISEEEIRTYLTDNNARINYIEMELKDGEGNMLKSEGKEKIKEMAEDYISRAKGGEDFKVLLKEYNDYYDKLIADAQTDGAETAEAAEDSEESGTEELPDNTMVVKKESAYPSADIINKVFDGSVKAGDVFFSESTDGEKYYVVQVLDLFADENYYEDNESSVRHTLKDEEFDAEVEGWTANQNVVKNEAAYKRYKIEKFMD